MAPKINIIKEKNPINYNSREVLNAKTYLEQHKIPEIITQLTTMLFYLQPENPKKFIAEKLVHIKEKKLDAYTYFTEENLKALFKIFDVTEKGYISTKQYLSAMEDIGVKMINDSPEGSKYNAISLETFVKEGMIGLHEKFSTVS
ncbi:EF-hand calcium-binding domain-containing protein 10-like protein [Piromyces finnis]|uniref:EF-hand calcium-binding domain-containing protein 10-like protein n=1 Tax=Piromyces finnis TaxID=1754191 RepID=A0A1Y1VPI4_9FUNG|nr:EF-hand calcium-binding domain-containing protein 10-like protein [Piromyces finnis]|eukprot:ORX61053.1 EF-hand calcium-binding domain-containing protein 10-like protein [Piromyces finnis]